MLNTKENKVMLSSQPNEKIISSVKPFIRWAGGKQNLVKELSLNLPNEKFEKYYEPFLGAASLYLYNDFPNSVLSDVNPHLINSYRCIRDAALDVHECLIEHQSKLSVDYYYQLRDLFNQNKNSFTVEQAAIFIFLVHTSFNGIYRVNQKGEYNVPFGKKVPAIPSKDHLLVIQKKLSGTELINCLYTDVIDKIETHDFVYFDPPYPPLNSTSFFQHYSIDKFPNEQQTELAKYALELSNKGVYVMISNAETPMIRELYKDWNIKEVSTMRYVNCKPDRKAVRELIITNY